MKLVLIFTSMLVFQLMGNAQFDTLTRFQFKEIVLENHPIAKQANLHIKRGASTLLMAKGKGNA